MRGSHTRRTRAKTCRPSRESTDSLRACAKATPKATTKSHNHPNQTEIVNNHPLSISTEDHSRLRLLVNSLSSSSRSETLRTLREELDRATVLDPKAMPSDVVRMNDRVEIEDLGTGEIEEYTLVFPDRANVEQRRLSVLAPIGTAVLGFAAGDEVNWNTPGGVRRLKIRRVSRSAASSANVVPAHQLSFSRSV